MKAHHYYSTTLFGLLILILLFRNEFVKAQNLIKYPNLQTNYFDNNGTLSFGNGNLLMGTGNLGIGTTTPSARLHIKSISGITNTALFQTEVRTSLLAPIASIQQCVSIQGQPYGFYETSSNSSGLLNYFQDPLQIGSLGLIGSSSGPVIATDPYITSLTFRMNPNSGPLTNPLIIYSNGIRVQSNLVTDNFQMLTGAGANKILASDASGNGTWTDPRNFLTDYWQPNGSGDIYTNYRRVGIGTTTPSQKLEICTTDKAGGVCINQLSRDSTTGSEIVFKKVSTPQCSIGQTINAGRSCCFIWSHVDTNSARPIGRTELFIDLRNGFTGIGNEWPQATLDVNGSFKAACGGIGIVPPSLSDSYKFWVDGGIAAREIKVTAGSFPDFVFEKNYQILPLNKLEEFIKKEKHLPQVPSQSDVDKNGGINVGEFQTKLLQKIEEQTLYIIALQKQIDELREDLKSK